MKLIIIIVFIINLLLIKLNYCVFTFLHVYNIHVLQGFEGDIKHKYWWFIPINN